MKRKHGKRMQKYQQIHEALTCAGLEDAWPQMFLLTHSTGNVVNYLYKDLLVFFWVDRNNLMRCVMHYE
ncbi:CLUMA_CG010417, isoform A [Clunio marinus]|uniref:CLUMA_CG010417, isoform A n=1 Tax=Clunio marinus TaxID=568069 RepID=A0A1J1IEN5_9DIPT|nr:CLUMA_CG010417, isoform A [Clunio marinus]